MINVKDFGAMGNGYTDDTYAIQQAFDTGLTVYIPEGRYIISETLYLKESSKPDFVQATGNRGQRVYGDGKERTILEVKTTESFWETETAVISVGTDQAQLDNFAIRNEMTRTINEKEEVIKDWASGIKLENKSPDTGRYITISNMYFRGLKYGIHMGRKQWCNHVTDVLIEHCYYGVYSAEEGNYNNFTRVNIDGCYIGFYFKVNNNTDPVSGTFFLLNLIGCRAELCEKYGIYIQGAGIINVTNSYFERNVERDIYVDVLQNNNKLQYTDKLNITGCYFSGFDTNRNGAFYLAGAKMTSIENCFFYQYKNGTLLAGVSAHEETGGQSVFMRANNYKYVSVSRFSSGQSQHASMMDNMKSDRIFTDYISGSNYGNSLILQPKQGATYGDLIINNSGYFYSAQDGGYTLGTGDKRWYSVYAKNGVIQTSDINEKENILSIDKTKAGISLNDCSDFVKNLELSTYNFKERKEHDDSTQVGFMAQDIKDSKVGSLIIQEEENSLNYSLSNYVNVLAGALKDALKRIEELENK